MTGEELLQFVKERPRLADGGMGTLLMVRGLKGGSCGELWSVERPEEVKAVHKEYIDAGSEMIFTNTFGGSSISLEKYGLAERAAELNRAAAQLARQVLEGTSVLLFGDIGPSGGMLEPYGTFTPEQFFQSFCEQADALAEGGVDAFIVETMTSPDELEIAVRAARRTGKAVIGSYAFEKVKDGVFRTMMGTTVQEAVQRAVEAGVQVVGSNCGTSLSLDDYLELARQLVAAAGDVPVILEPNAGTPDNVDGKIVYPATPQDMAELVPKLVDVGVRIIGGCCGTTPAHLRAMRQALDACV